MIQQPATPIRLGSGTDDEAVTAAGTPTVLRGFACDETAGASAEFVLRDGTSNSGAVIMTVTLAANESVRESFPSGIAITTALWLERVTGNVDVTVYV